VASGCPAAYRARSPRATPLYRLIEGHFDEVRGQWEERFERRYGFWRDFVDEQVLQYLDCGLFENGFARIRCPDCAEEYLLAFSCKRRKADAEHQGAVTADTGAPSRAARDEIRDGRALRRSWAQLMRT